MLVDQHVNALITDEKAVDEVWLLPNSGLISGDWAALAW
jgi:hypothetical protein